MGGFEDGDILKDSGARPVGDFRSFCISGEGCSEALALKEDEEALVVLVERIARRLCLGVDVDADASEKEGVFCGGQVGDPSFLKKAACPLVCGEARGRSVVEVRLDREVCENGGHSSDVVQVIVRRDDQVERVNLILSELVQDPCVGSGIDEDGASFGSYQGCVPLADVEEVDPDFLGPEHSCLRGEETGEDEDAE